jgi:DNA-binding NtrC family response regulator
VDDEPLKRITLQIELAQAGYTVLEAPDAASALKLLQARPVDVVITDLRMPQVDGLQFLEQVKARFSKTHVILMTAYGSVDSAVAAIKHGAYDYLTKPFGTESLLEKLDHLRSARAWVSDAKQAEPAMERIGSLIGQSHAARRLFERIRVVSSNEHTLLIEGEPGTGKSRVAEAVHQLSRRSAQPMATFSCTSCPARALDAELCTRLEHARGSTLFLRDIDALPLEVQRKLLHVVEHQRIERAGEAQPVPIDVRLICATSRDLRALMEAGLFRRDLHLRLSAVSLFVPPLRDRREDISVLAEHYLQRHAPRMDRRPLPSRFSPHALEALLGYHWPGNVRELEHVLERAATVATGERIERKDILLPQEAPADITTAARTISPAETAPGLTRTIAGIERSLIDAALQRAAGNQARAAQILGIPRTTLRDKMAKHGMASHSARNQPTA